MANENPVKFKSVVVEEAGRQMEVFYPDSGDRSETQDIRESAIEKTKQELRAKPPREQSKRSKEDVSAFIRDQRDHQKREGKKYF